MMSTIRATMEAPTPTPTWASRGNVDCGWLSYCTLPREKFRFPILTWKAQTDTDLIHNKEETAAQVGLNDLKHLKQALMFLYTEFLSNVYSQWTQADYPCHPVSYWLSLGAAGLVVHNTNDCGSVSSPNTRHHLSEPPPRAYRWLDPGSLPRIETYNIIMGKSSHLKCLHFKTISYNFK